MPLRINDEAPNFTAKTTQGDINFHAWIGDQWAVLFSHPKDFTPVCTTELGYMAGLESEFKKRNCKIIGLSVDPVENHTEWAKDIEETQGHAVNYPMIGDSEAKLQSAVWKYHADGGRQLNCKAPFENCARRRWPTLHFYRGYKVFGRVTEKSHAQVTRKPVRCQPVSP